MMYLGENIRYLRKKHGWSQEYLSNLLGYKNFTSVQKWESGITEPRFKTVQELAKIFDVGIDELTKTNIAQNELIKTVAEKEISIHADMAEEYNTIIQTLHDRPEMKMLFKSAEGATAEQIMQIASLLDSFKENT